MPHERPAFPSRPLSPLLGAFFPYTNVKSTNGRISLDFSVFCVTSVVKPFRVDGSKLQHRSTERILERVRKRNQIAGTARPGGNRDELWALRSRFPDPPSGQATLPWPSRRAPRRTVAAQRTRTHPQARAERRRNVVKRGVAVTTKVSSGGGSPQPVAASRTLRIDALNGPTRQILHAVFSLWNRA